MAAVPKTYRVELSWHVYVQAHDGQQAIERAEEILDEQANSAISPEDFVADMLTYQELQHDPQDVKIHGLVEKG